MDVRLPDGTIITNVPEGTTQSELMRRVGLMSAQPAPTDRTWGEAAKDVGAGVVSGVGSLVQLPGQLYGLATGDFSKTGSLGLGEDISKYGEEMKSAGLKAREAERSAKVQEAEKEGQFAAFKAALGETIKDPALITSFLAEQAPQILPMLLTGGATAAITAGRASAAALAKGATKEAAADAAKIAATKAGTTAAIETGAVMQGADVGAGTYDEIYKELRAKGMSEEQAAAETINKARAAGLAGYALSKLANKYLPGGKALEEVLAGKKLTGSRIGTGAVTGIKEIPGENIEEVGGRVAQNIAAQQAGLDRELTAGAGETAAMATLGAAGMGGGAGLLAGRAPTKDIPAAVDQTTDTTQQQDQTTDTNQKQESTITSLADIFADKPAPKTSPEIDTLKAEYDQREAEIKEMEARGVTLTGKEKGELYGKRQKQKKLKARIDALAQTTTQGATDVAGTQQPAGGTSPVVPTQPTPELPTTGGTVSSERDGMVSAGPDVSLPATREAGEPVAVTPPAEPTTPPTAPVTPSTTGETLGTETAETVKTETQGQEPAAAPEVTGPRQELLTKRKAQAEALGIDLRDIQQDEIDAQIAETETRIGQKFNEERKSVVYDDDTQNFIEEAEKGGLSPQFGWEGEKLGAFEDMLERNGIEADTVLKREQDTDVVPEAERAAQLKAALDALNAKREQLREWNRLTADQKRVYLDNLATNELGQITPLARQKALEALNRYTAKKERTATGEVQGNREEGLYETQRTAYNKRTGLSLPPYSELTDAEKAKFKQDLKYRKKNGKTVDPTVENIDSAFSNLSKSISERRGAQKTDEKAALQETELKSYEKAQGEIETERAQREANKGRPSPVERIGRGAFIPSKAAEQVKAGNTENVLNYLRTQAKNKLHKAVAQAISNLKLKTKIKYVDKLPKGRLAEYDPKTDTILVTAEGMTDAIILHEFVHAATIKVLDQYEKGNLKGLTDAQIEAAEMLEDLMNRASDQLGTRYPDAFENLFEFVSYALTDKFFQEDLAGVRLDVKQKNKIVTFPTILPETKSAWSEFMTGVLNVLGLTKKMFQGQETNYEARNALLEVFQAFESIAGASTERIEREALPAKKPAAQQERKKAEPQDNSVDAILKRNELPEISTVSNIRKHYGTRKAYNYLKKKFQNSRDSIKRWEDALSRAGKIIYSGSSLNDVYTQIVLSSGRAKDLYLTRVEPAASDLRNAINDYAKATGQTVDEAARDLHVLGMARHEGERRDVKYMLNVPLSTSKTNITLPNGTTLNIAPSEFRIRAMDAIFSGKLSVEQIKELRTALNDVVAKHADPTGFSGINGAEPGGYKSVKRDAAEYNVVGGYSPADMQKVTEALYTSKDNKTKAAVDKAMKALQGLHKATTELDKESNYWSKPVQSVVDFYGWENYIPLKGKQHFVNKNDDLLSFDGPRLGTELQDKQYSFEGRETESDNSILQSMVDATRAAMRAGRKDVTLAIKNSVKDADSKKRLLYGEIKATIPFADRYKAAMQEYSGPNYVYHYNPDGSVDIILLRDKEQREAIKRTYQESQPLIDALNTVTSTIGQMHTRYNIAFGPMNFVRDALTNAFTIGAEMGPKAAAQYIGAISAKVATGGLFKAGNVARLYEAGNFAEIERLAAKDPYVADMYEYIQKGGKVSYLQGISSKSQQQELQRDLGSGNLKKAKAAVDKVVDIWVDTFELASRAAAYQVSKSQFMAQGMNNEEAATKAAGYAKNLANFEQVGEWGRAAGAAFMFFRPAATGAVRAIEALEPSLRSVESAMADLPLTVRNDPAAVKKFKEEYKKQKRSAQAMTLGLLGMGVAIYGMAYMLADDDDQGRNKVATDDATRWSRYARFFIPGFETPLQLPWGFGLGAFAAAGAQIASVGLGNTSVKDALTNTALIGMDSFLPLPVSRINPMDQPAAWLMDSALPSALRPFLEWTMNVDGLGREIYNNRQSRFGDAYTGGDNIPELYKTAVRTLYEITNGGVDWSPNTLYFFANNYLDGVSRLGHGAHNIALVAAGDKEFNPKTDTLIFDSFFGAPSNIDAREFSNVEKQILNIQSRLKTLQVNSPERYADYIENNPLHPALVDTYNRQVNQTLRNLREQANVYRRMQGLTPKERTELVKNIVQAQNLVKRNMLDVFEAYEIKP